MYAAVTNEHVTAYLQTVKSLARRYVDRSILCEFDDLVQEGLIAVWESLCDSRPPSAEYIQLAMKQYRRKMRRLRKGDTLVDDFMYIPPTVDHRSVLGE